MAEKARFMEAVAEKVGRRKPMMKRKGGPSVIIAIGAPKPAPMGKKMDDEMADDDMQDMSKAEKIAALQEKIAALKAELALLEDDEEMDDESEMDSDDEDYEGGSGDED
jgi:hypothetical protein